MTKSERDARFELLCRIGCIVCRRVHRVFSHPSIHHLTGIKYRSTGKKANDRHTIPLCHCHHQGALGIHVLGMRPWERRFGTQEELLAEVNELIGKLH